VWLSNRGDGVRLSYLSRLVAVSPSPSPLGAQAPV
jgi:hypothetical protein